MTNATDSAVSYQTETVRALWPELERLLGAHNREVEHFPDLPFKPDREGYEQLEHLGALVCMTVRGEDTTLLGYLAFVLGPDPHHGDTVMARAEALYVIPERRDRDLGRQLIRFAELRLRERGVVVVYQATRAANHLDFGGLLHREGYRLVEHLYAKRLDHGAAA